MMVHDMINTAKDEASANNLLSQTGLQYEFLKPIIPNETHNLETMDTTLWFLFEDDTYKYE